jgi:hypothetical protein
MDVDENDMRNESQKRTGEEAKQEQLHVEQPV